MTVRAKKSLGQHFLCDEQVIAKIIHCINPQPGQEIIEIGPGLGALTLPLLQHIGKLTVVELDERVLAYLRTQMQPYGDLYIHHGDVLKFDFTRGITSGKKWRVCGNLPYQISTPLLFHLLEHPAVIDDMVFMVQKEVAMRITAAPGTKQYGRLSVMLQYACRCDALFMVPPEAFDPVPRVDSAVIRLYPYTTLPYMANDTLLFAQVVRNAFAQRRKTIKNSLSKLLTVEQLADLEIPPNTRAEELSVAKYVKICNYLEELQ